MNVSNEDTASASSTTNKKYARIMNQLDDLTEERARIANLSMRSEQLARDTHDIKMRVDILMNEVDVFDQFIYNIFHCLTQGWFSHSTRSS